MPDTWKPDIDAYCQTLADNHIMIEPDFIERIVVHPRWRIAGTLDRLVTIHGDTKRTVADLKTGKDAVTYGAGEIAIQLAIYANSTHMWAKSAEDVKRDRYGRYELPHPDENPGEYVPMPDVHTDRALIIHLPVGEGVCTIHEIDLTAGNDALERALWVRDWRKRRDLTRPFKPKGGHLTVVPKPVDDDW